MTDVIGKLLQDNNMPDTPTARAIYKKMLEPDGDAPLTLNGVALYPRREWVGLTEAELQFQLAKHHRLVNAHYDKGVDTNIITETFDSTSFYNEVVAILKEKNAN